MCVVIDNPPVNALSQAVRAALMDTFEAAEKDPAVQAVVLCGAGKHFVGGADIREFGQTPQAPFLPEVCSRIETSPLLVVASLQGVSLGGGLELALSADYRIATPEALLGLPEVKLGLIPGAGGTQRLPRLIGVDAAIDMISSGRRVSAQEGEAMGLLDRVQPGSAVENGLAFATDLLARPAPRRPLREAPAPHAVEWDAAEARIEKRARGQIAPLAALEAVRASVDLPFEAGLAAERQIFTDLMHSDQRDALVHLFFAERATARLPELQEVKARDIHSVGIVGGGMMGAGIASAVLMAGLPVTLIEASEAACVSARDRIAQNLEGAMRRGKLTHAAYESALGEHLTLSPDYKMLGTVDLVIEAVFEDLAVKKAVFEQLSAVSKEGAILATNTSYLDVNEIARATTRPENVVGLHFFAPAHVMKLLEIVVPDRAALPVVAASFAFAKRLGKCAVRAGVSDGFIGNRLLGAYRSAADQLVLEGAAPHQVDQAIEAFGFPMGPYAVADLSGLDIGWANRKRRAPLRDARERGAAFPDRLCEAGHLGRKSGSGYYLYGAEHPSPVPNPVALDLIDAERALLAIAPREFSPDQIASRILAAITLEAARVLEEGVARYPRDIDVVMVAGYGFPRHRGGPCKWADLTGLGALLAEIEAYALEDAYFWRPAQLLADLAEKGQQFDDLNP